MNIRADTQGPNVRRSIEDEIERLIGLLDDMEPDTDLEETGDDEPTLGATENHPGAHGGGMQADWYRLNLTMGDDEPTLGSLLDHKQWSAGYAHEENPDGEREDENEHGGDVGDEPHDHADCGDDEPFLGWSETCGLGADEFNLNGRRTPGIDPTGEERCGLDFRGDGYQKARADLRKAKSRKEPRTASKRARALQSGAAFPTSVAEDAGNVFQAILKLERTTLEELEALARRQPPGII